VLITRHVDRNNNTTTIARSSVLWLGQVQRQSITSGHHTYSDCLHAITLDAPNQAFRNQTIGRQFFIKAFS
jgi:hypothetical protein